jgi:hypothetical protein
MCRNPYECPYPTINYWLEGVPGHVCILLNIQGHMLKDYIF